MEREWTGEGRGRGATFFLFTFFLPMVGENGNIKNIIFFIETTPKISQCRED